VKIVLGDLYETELGIYNHFGPEAKKRPLASVAFHPIEDVHDGGSLQLAMRIYMDRNIREYFGLTFLEHISLPKDIYEMMNQIALENMKKRTAAMESIEKSMTN
jgi:hypothetical protein